MRTILLCLIAVLLVSGTALAEEGPEPPGIEDATDLVLAAFKAKNSDALKALAERPEPDAWLVADELCVLGEHDAAEAFAKAAQSTDNRQLRADTEKLPAYVEAWRKRAPDVAERDASERDRLYTLYDAIDSAIESGDTGALQKVVDALVPFQGEPGSVLQIQLLDARGEAQDLLGRHEKYEVSLARTAKAAHSVGWLRRAQSNYYRAGKSADRRCAWGAAIPFWNECLVILKRRGANVQVAELLTKIGLVHWRCGAYREAMEASTLARDRMKRLKSVLGEANAVNNIGLVHGSRGKLGEAQKSHKLAIDMLLKLGTPAARSAAATTRGNLGNVHLRRGQLDLAMEAYELALKEMEALQDGIGVANMTNNMGRVYLLQGDFNRAKTKFDKALARKVALKHSSAATTHGNLGSLFLAQGMYAEALRKYDTALAMMKDSGLRAGEADILSKFGDVHQSLGDYPMALRCYTDARSKMNAMGARAGEAATLGNIGSVHQKRGDHQQALTMYKRARDMLAALGDRAGEVTTLGNIGVALDALGRYEEALKTYNDALKTYEALGDRVQEAMTLANIGEAHQHLGQLDDARNKLTEGVDLAEELGAVPQQVAALAMLARLHLQMGKPSRAWSSAKAAMREIEELLKDLGDEEGAAAREQHHVIFGVGALAAAREESTSDLCKCLEGGRASGLLEMLGGREAMAWRSNSLGEDLRREATKANEALQLAQDAHSAASQKDDRAGMAAADVALRSAKLAVGAAEARKDRKRKEEAGLGAFRPKGIRDIRKSLEDDQALVLYGLVHDETGPESQHLDEALALVLRKGAEPRIVSLGKTSVLETACAPLTSGASDSPLARLRSPGRRGRQKADPQKDWDTAVGRLKDLLVKPLDLEENVKQVLIAPEGALCYLPFGVLFEQTVIMTPSGTTHIRLLKDAEEKGQGVLALGNPDYAGVTEGARSVYYRGAILENLQATATEVEALGTKKLLGQDASEAGLRAALPTSKRWRSIHLACHGLVDTERPMLSSLALSRTGEDDGFLTAREILGMSMPTDLAVLSACDTGRGKIAQGEGILGFTRALMFAGAPRVICSLWKVDDAATAALMIKFYELWNPKDGEKGLGAGDALKAAQAFVQGQEKWKAPHFWAAWALWGLPN